MTWHDRRESKVRLPAAAYPPITLAGLIAIWEIAARVLEIPAYLLPRPTAIGAEVIDRWGLLLEHGLATSLEILLGFLSAAVVGFPLAVLIVYSRMFERSVYPLLVGAQVVPKVAIAPLFIVWFGFGLTPKVMIAFLIAFFPVVIASVVGMRATPPEMLHLVRSMGATGWQTFWQVRFPIALPSVFGGLKVAVTLAVVGAVVAEFVGADRGLGYLIQVAIGQLNTNLLFASIVALSLIGIILFLLLDIVERRLLSWHVSQRAQQVYGSA